MHAIRVTRELAQTTDLSGRVLCHELRSDDGRVAIAKGRVLDDADSRRAFELPWTELHLLALDSDDVHEDAAGDAIARLVAGGGVAVRPVGRSLANRGGLSRRSYDRHRPPRSHQRARWAVCLLAVRRAGRRGGRGGCAREDHSLRRESSRAEPCGGDPRSCRPVPFTSASFRVHRVGAVVHELDGRASNRAVSRRCRREDRVVRIDVRRDGGHAAGRSIRSPTRLLRRREVRISFSSPARRPWTFSTRPSPRWTGSAPE